MRADADEWYFVTGNSGSLQFCIIQFGQLQRFAKNEQCRNTESHQFFINVLNVNADCLIITVLNANDDCLTRSVPNVI